MSEPTAVPDAGTSLPHDHDDSALPHDNHSALPHDHTSALPHDAVVLAGGGGSRLGGLPKGRLVVGGEPMLDRVLRATADAQRVVVVGDANQLPGIPPSVLVTREDPPGTGPAAGLLAGLDALAQDARTSGAAAWTLVLAVDLPDAAAAVAELLAAATTHAEDPEVDGVALTGTGDVPQHLLAVYRTDRLREAFAAYGDPTNRSVKGLMASLRLTLVEPQRASTDDIDTWEAHERWHVWRPFVADVCAGTGLDAAAVDETAVLALTRDVAHAGAKPVAPVAAYLMGQLLGRDPDLTPAAARERVWTAAQRAMPLAPRGEEPSSPLPDQPATHPAEPSTDQTGGR